MENRKLSPVRIPSWEEVAAHIAILEDIGSCDTQVAETCYAWNGIHNGLRNTEKQASVYDAMMAELHGDKARRAEKFRKTHDKCKKSKDDTPADRKRNKIRHMRKMYGRMWEDGKEWCWAYGREGRKQTTEPDADILINRKIAEMEKSARDDGTESYYREVYPEHYVGTTTISGMIDRLLKRLNELRKPYEDAGYECFERYYYERDGVYRHMRYYSDEYRSVHDDYEVLCTLWNILRARKMHEVTEYDSDEEENYFVEVGMRRFHDLLAEMHPQPHYINEGWLDWRDYEDALNKRYWESLGELDSYLWDNSISHMWQENDDEEEDWYE